ncbi:transmembrane protein, putative [Bodo saltans]|uniref:Transmembrane protein, putative n=1 Tax=Bodo saltans TaxID=75058 RepID=A0A0S4JHW5_BODSA|nr:transmembrane protein, putative [Bodo saltans]|eukprot:CUG89748.1 transmembrane protein, putative [Bodo saltans]
MNESFINSTHQLLLFTNADPNVTTTPSPQQDDSAPSYWWMHGLVSFLFFIMAVAAITRVARRINQTRNVLVRTEEGAADIMRDLPQRQERSSSTSTACRHHLYCPRRVQCCTLHDRRSHCRQLRGWSWNV